MYSKIFLLFSVFFCNSLFAKDGVYTYSMEQKSNDYNQTISIKKIEMVKENKKESSLSVKDYNDKKIVNMRIGVQSEEFELKGGKILKSSSPSIDIAIFKKLSKSFNFEFDIQASKNNIIVRELLSFDLVKLLGIEIDPYVRLGQKVALTEQLNSGYIFANTGIISKYEGELFILKADVYLSPAQFNSVGYYFEVMYKMERNSIGLYFSKDLYNPLNMKNEREGHINNRMGIVYKF